MKKFSFLSFLFLIYMSNCAYKIIDKEEFYSFQKYDKRSFGFYNSVIDHLKQILNYYVYIDLFKNPPQPSFDPNYFPKMDTFAKLEEIRSEISDETYYYDFFRKIRFVIDNYRDAHLSYGFNGFTTKYQFLCPIKLTTIKDEGGNIYMTGEIAYNDESYFVNGTEVLNTIKANLGNPISKINGKSPFEFIQNFGGDFFKLKNKQANYAFQTHQYLSPFLLYFPLNEDEIKIIVEYENGDKFETEFAIAERVNSEEISNENNLYHFYNDINIEKEFMKYIENYFNNNDYGTIKSLTDFLSDFEKSKNVHNNLVYKNENKNGFNYENILSENESKFSKIKWDYEYDIDNPKYFQCRVDTENNLNVIHMPTFDYGNITKIVELLKNCVELFDKNEFNIVVLLNFNGGGKELVSQTLVEYIQPFITSRFYSTFRHGQYLDKYYDINFEDHSIVETCKVPDKKYVLDNIQSIDYGEGVINNITKPFRRFGQHREEFNKEKNILKNKRKPNEIIIFTDGYSASAASLFTKSLQNEGGAIVVGYNGNPVSNDIFDGSQHFSTVFFRADLEVLEKDLMNEMRNEGIYFTQMCATGNLFDYRELKVPEEFNIMEVDKISDIYEAYEEEKNYDIFMKKANQIFDEFQTKCNIKNKRLTLFDDKCSFVDDKYAHGGHPCNEQETWDMNKCQKVYCDEGYLLDYKENKCVRDPCLPEKDDGDDGNNQFGNIIKINEILFVLISLILIF